MASAVADQSSVGQLIEPHSQQTSNMNKQHKLICSPREEELLKRHSQDPPSLCLHLYSTYFKFEHEDGFFSYKSQFKDFLLCIKERRLPGDLMDVFNEASCRYYDGCLIVEIHDHRSESIEIKRVVMRPTAESIWTDVALLSEDWGFPWTEDVALEVEAKILVAAEEPLCLDPSIQVTRVSNAIEYVSTPKKVKKKLKWNSVEREQKLAKQAEHLRLMTLKDNRAKRPFPFEPSFSKISYLQDWRSKKQKANAEPLPAIDVKKGKGRKSLLEPITLPDGRKCVRSIRFERPEGDKKIYTLINIYLLNGHYDGVFRWGTAYDTSLNGG
ncbi:Transcription factor spt20, partial [Rhizopus azygosporus]